MGGEEECSILKVRFMLNCIRYSIGNQCNFFHSGVMLLKCDVQETIQKCFARSVTVSYHTVGGYKIESCNNLDDC